MKRIIWIPLLLLFFSLSVAPAAAQNRFRAVSGGFGTAIHAVLWVGYEKKIFQKYGLDMEYLAIENGTVSMQTLLANETQAAFTTGALAVTANLQGGDSTIIAGGINFIPNKLVTRPDIKRPEDLKGKRIAISRFGSASDYATQLALEKLNVNPKDVTIIQAGGNSTRFSAIVGGSIHATLLSEPLTTMALRDHKMNSLIDLAESGVPFPQNAFLVRRSYLEANRAKVVNFMKGVIEGYYHVEERQTAGDTNDQEIHPRQRRRRRHRLRLLSRQVRRRRDGHARPQRYRVHPRPGGERKSESQRADA